MGHDGLKALRLAPVDVKMNPVAIEQKRTTRVSNVLLISTK